MPNPKKAPTISLDAKKIKDNITIDETFYEHKESLSLDEQKDFLNQYVNVINLCQNAITRFCNQYNIPNHILTIQLDDAAPGKYPETLVNTQISNAHIDSILNANSHNIFNMLDAITIKSLGGEQKMLSVMKESPLHNGFAISSFEEDITRKILNAVHEKRSRALYNYIEQAGAGVDLDQAIVDYMTENCDTWEEKEDCKVCPDKLQ